MTTQWTCAAALVAAFASAATAQTPKLVTPTRDGVAVQADAWYPAGTVFANGMAYPAGTALPGTSGVIPAGAFTQMPGTVPPQPGQPTYPGQYPQPGMPMTAGYYQPQGSPNFQVVQAGHQHPGPYGNAGCGGCGTGGYGNQPVGHQYGYQPVGYYGGEECCGDGGYSSGKKGKRGLFRGRR
jgi:hypothetical protein